MSGGSDFNLKRAICQTSQIGCFVTSVRHLTDNIISHLRCFSNSNDLISDKQLGVVVYAIVFTKNWCTSIKNGFIMYAQFNAQKNHTRAIMTNMNFQPD